MAAKVSKAGKYLNLRETEFGSIALSGDQVVVAIDASAANIGSFLAENCTALERFTAVDSNMSELQLAGSVNVSLINVADCAELTDIDISEIGSDISQITATGCNLSEETVDHILITLDETGVLGGQVFLNGGTSAPPSATGLTSKSNLEGKGWTVTVNEA